jgi:hypothetical protein
MARLPWYLKVAHERRNGDHLQMSVRIAWYGIPFLVIDRARSVAWRGLRRRTPWVCLLLVPRIWWRHYRIGRGRAPAAHRLRVATGFTWHYLKEALRANKY